MATVETVVLECDICHTEGHTVETHTVVLDGEAVELEACEKDWVRARTTLGPLLDAGRRIRRRRR